MARTLPPVQAIRAEIDALLTEGRDLVEVIIVKGNQPTLHRRLKALPWREAVLNDRTDEQGRGRREIRRMKICTALRLPIIPSGQVRTL